MIVILKFIVVVIAGYAIVITTLQKFIVVVAPCTRVPTSVPLFIVMRMTMRRMRMRAQKYPLKSLKIRYAIVNCIYLITT